MPPPSPPPASGGTASPRRPIAAKSALKETLPEFIPGFNEKIQYFMKEYVFGDGNERKLYVDKYSNMIVFGFNLEKEYCNRRTFQEDINSVGMKRQILASQTFRGD